MKTLRPLFLPAILSFEKADADHEIGGRRTSHKKALTMKRILALFAALAALSLPLSSSAYTIHFNANGGEGTMVDQTIVDGLPASLATNAFTNTNGFFVGWALTPDGNATLLNGDSTDDIFVEEDGEITLYGVWHEGIGDRLPKNGLVAYYPFNGDIDDKSGNAHNLENNGGTFFQDRIGNPNAAISFDGQKHYANHPDIMAAHTFSVACWFKTSVGKSSQGSSETPASSSIRAGNAILFPAHGGNNAGVGLSVGTDGLAVTEHGDSYLPTPFSYNAPIGTDWNHVCMVVENDTDARLYLNGGLVAAGNLSTRSKQFGVTVGGSIWGYYTGAIDDLCVFDRVLTQEEIQDVMNPFSSYAVRFDANGGEGAMEKRVYAAGDDVTLPTLVFAKTGWAFVGWATEPDGPVVYADGETVEGGIDAANGATVTLYARWAQSQYAVRFDANGGTGTMSDQTLWLGIPGRLSTNAFSYNDLAFSGWATQPDGPVAYGNGAGVSNLCADGESITLYAVWSVSRGLKALYYDISSISDSSWHQQVDTYEECVAYFAAMTPTIVTNTVGLGDALDFGDNNNAGTAHFHGKYAQKGTENFVLYLNGVLECAESGLYSFNASHDDGCVVYLDGNSVYSKSAASSGWNTFSVDLSAGYHGIIVAMHEGSGGQRLQFQLKHPGETSWSPFSQSVLYDTVPYILTLDTDGGSGGSTITNIYGAAIDPSANPSREGYTFAGWDPSVPATMPPSNMTCRAQWTPIRYTVHFDANGGMGEMDDLSLEYDNPAALSAVTFTQSGRVFAGWATELDGPAVYANTSTVSNLTTEANGEVTLYAVWANSGIVFDANGGEGTMEPFFLFTGTEQTLPKCVFFNTNGFFLGWALMPGGEAMLFDGDTTTDIVVAPGDTVTLYAVWHGGDGISRELLHRWSFNGDLTDSVGGQDAVAYGNVTGDGRSYRLSGGNWNSSYIDLGQNVLPRDGGAATIELWATQHSFQKWSRIFDFGTGSGDGNYIYMAWNGQNSLNSPVRIYAVGENSNDLGPYENDREYHFAMVFNPDANGIWDVKVYQQDATTGETLAIVTFSSSGTNWSLQNQGMDQCWLGKSRYSADSDANASYNEVRIWGTALSESDLTENVLKGSDANLATSYAVRFDANGGEGTMPKRVFAYGDNVTLPSTTFTRDGYTFVGWATSADGPMEYGDGETVTGGFDVANGETITLYARWSTGTYTVHFDANGGMGAMPDQTLWLDVPQPLATNAFVREGFAFVGWAVAPDGQPVCGDGGDFNHTGETGDAVTLYAEWALVPGLAVRYYDIPTDSYATWTQSESAMMDYFAAQTPTIETNTLAFGETLQSGFQSNTSATRVFQAYPGLWLDSVSTNRYHGKYSARSQDHFAMFFDGKLYVSKAGEYSFAAACDNAIVLYIDGARVCGSSDYASPAEGVISLSLGLHRITIATYEDVGDQGMFVEWKEPGDTSWSPLPQSSLFHLPIDQKLPDAAILWGAVDISSALGSPEPDGRFDAPWGATVEVSMPLPLVIDPDDSGVRQACVGWVGTGSIPATGSETNVSFVLRESSALTWLWETNSVWVSLAVEGDAEAGGETEGWFALGTDAVLSFAPTSADAVVCELSGDAEGVTVDAVARTVTIPADRPRSVTAHVRAMTPADSLETGEAGDWSGVGGGIETAGGWHIAPDATAADGYSLRNDEITAGETATVELAVPLAGTLTFDWRVLTTARRHYARFYVDGVRQKQITGETDWATETIALGDGAHVLRWTYEKSNAATSGEDAAFLDNVHWTPLTLAAALDATNVVWSTEGGAEWIPQVSVSSDGASAARSGALVGEETSRLVATVRGEGTFAWFWKAEIDGIAGVDVYLDGEWQEDIWLDLDVVDWEEMSLDIVGAGTHEVVFAFWNGGGVDDIGDCAYIDSVSWSGQEERTLLVESEYGTALPAVGAHLLLSGDMVLASVAAPEPENGMRRICTGWTGTGSVPGTGTETNVAFTIQQDSILSWNWRTDYWTQVDVTGGTCNFTAQWVETGSQIEVTISPTSRLYAITLSGDTEGATLDGTNLCFAADRPRTIQVSVEDKTPPELTVPDLSGPGGLSFGTDGAGSPTFNVRVANPVPGVYYTAFIADTLAGPFLADAASRLAEPSDATITFALAAGDDRPSRFVRIVASTAPFAAGDPLPEEAGR